MHLPLIQIRYYSISSSLERTKNEVHLTVTLAEHRTKGKIISQLSMTVACFVLC